MPFNKRSFFLAATAIELSLLLAYGRSQYTRICTSVIHTTLYSDTEVSKAVEFQGYYEGLKAQIQWNFRITTSFGKVNEGRNETWCTCTVLVLMVRTWSAPMWKNQRREALSRKPRTGTGDVAVREATLLPGVVPLRMLRLISGSVAR